MTAFFLSRKKGFFVTNITLIESGGGTGPMKPGNLSIFSIGKVPTPAGTFPER